MALFYAAVGIVLFFLGVHALLIHGHLFRKILGANIMGNGVFMVFIALAVRASEGSDPIPQAMVLTGIVVTVAFTAVALTLAVILLKKGEQADQEDQSEKQR